MSDQFAQRLRIAVGVGATLSGLLAITFVWVWTMLGWPAFLGAGIVALAGVVHALANGLAIKEAVRRPGSTSVTQVLVVADLIVVIAAVGSAIWALMIAPAVAYSVIVIVVPVALPVTLGYGIRSPLRSTAATKTS